MEFTNDVPPEPPTTVPEPSAILAITLIGILTVLKKICW
ncbi:hypothetical protein CWATWH0402_427 [Crocosphaera watsonii WH 0402]|uniref:PEP-CTERM protein-sorting domain-containing protein n=1 Tax=Crocosphaera watsonii WH 0402 TaxID=1284629 RepID=T2JSN6_CROWT|nr:hypothetical protein CWATWH0402_427 [Crocosphaera watsonii WH 0402]